MQDKHVVIFRANEDRDIFINKCTLPKTVYQIRDKGIPEEGDIVVDKHQVIDWMMCKFIIDNYDNLPEYTIFTSADPRDHVVNLEIAIHCKFTSGYGSFCFGRSFYSQYTFGWERIHPSQILANLIGLGMVNDDNCSKQIYPCQPGTIFYVHKSRILQHSKSFYENIVNWDNDNKLREYYLNYKHPDWFWQYLSYHNPETKALSKIERLEKSIQKSMHRTGRQDFFGLSMECLWTLMFMSKEEFNLLEKSQAVIGNKLYFNTRLEKYNSNFLFTIYPYEKNIIETNANFLLMENNWFDYNDPTYILWKEKLLEKLYYEFHKEKNESLESFWQRSNKNDIMKSNKVINFLNRLKSFGYKHITI